MKNDKNCLIMGIVNLGLGVLNIMFFVNKWESFNLFAGTFAIFVSGLNFGSVRQNRSGEGEN